MAGSSEYLWQGISELANNNTYECGADYVLEEIPDGLKCPLCKKMFDTPLQLPCMHTFCLKCIENAVVDPNKDRQRPEENGNQQAPPVEPPAAPPAEPPAEPAPVVEETPLPKKTVCPECKETVELKPEATVLDTIPINYLLQISIEGFESRRAGGPRCGECIEKNEVVNFCTTCPLSLCEQCSQYHLRMKKYVSHDLKPAAEVSEEQLLQGYMKYCALHKNQHELIYFCTQCKTSVCILCKDSKVHKGHEVYLASDVLEDEKLVVDGDIQKGLKASKNLTAFLVVAEQMLQQSEEEKGKSIIAVEQSFTSLQNMLNAQKAKLITTITQNHEAGVQSLKSAQQKAAILAKLLEYSQEALNVAGQFGNIEVVAILKTQMDSMYAVLDVPRISEAAVVLPADGVAANQPTVEVLGVVNTLFNESKGNVNVQIKKKVLETKQDKLKTITETCQKAMVLFDQN